MGLFGYMFGAGQYSQSKLSMTEHQLSSVKIRQLVSRVRVRSLDIGEERIVEEAIIRRRLGDGKISLRQIDETLFQLQQQKKISQYDRKGLVKQFSEFFEKSFGE
jgi:hypothetical protein